MTLGTNSLFRQRTQFVEKTHFKSDIFTLIQPLGTVNQCKNVGFGYPVLSQTYQNEVLIGKIS